MELRLDYLDVCLKFMLMIFNCEREGYLRTSSEQYDLDLNKVDNQLIHLTNNAI